MKIRVGLIGAAGYTGGELLRLLVNHPKVEVVFAHSESNAGNKITQVHTGLEGDTDLIFTQEMPLENVDLVFLCLGHGKSKEFIDNHCIPERLKIIDLAQDFRLKKEGNAFVYGLPELNKECIAKAKYVANPGCFATCIQLALLPLAKQNLLHGTVSINALTGSTGAGQKPNSTTHFSWRYSNISIYKPFTHQHLLEIKQSLVQEQGVMDASIDFLPYRGDFARGIFTTVVMHTDAEKEHIESAFRKYYSTSPFTLYSERFPDLKQVVNTNKAIVHCNKYEDRLLIVSCIDNLLKGAVGQAVENMNIMFSFAQDEGLRLKASAF